MKSMNLKRNQFIHYKHRSLSKSKSKSNKSETKRNIKLVNYTITHHGERTMLATRYGAMRQKLSIIYIKPDQIFPIPPFSVNGNSNFDSFLSLIPHFQTNSKFYYSYLQTIFRT